jgi:hypothetical protein
MSEDKCTATSHQWPAEWVDGDSCNCGQFYLTHDEAGGMRLDEAMEPDEEG